MSKASTRNQPRPIASVILTVSEGTDTIHPALLSVLTSTLTAVEVIVMIPDDESAIGVAVGTIARTIARADSRVRPVRAPSAGRAEVRNAGAAGALGDVLVFVDAGTFLDAGALTRIANCLAGFPSVTAVRGRVEPIPVPDHDLRAVEVIADRQEGTTGDVLAVRRADWDVLGGFDPALAPCEDQSWLLRLIAGGGTARAMTVATLGWGGERGRPGVLTAAIADMSVTQAWRRLYGQVCDAFDDDTAVVVACRRQWAHQYQALARTLIAAGSGDRLRPLTLLLRSLRIDASLAVRHPVAVLRTGLGALTTAMLSWRLGQIIGGGSRGGGRCGFVS